MTTNNELSDILQDYNKSLDEICPKFGSGTEHDYEQLDQQFISRNIVELDLICLQCGGHKYIYQYLEDSEL